MINGIETGQESVALTPGKEGTKDTRVIQKRILEEIRLEDESDPVKPIGAKMQDKQDLRKVKINKAPIEQRPDPKLKNMRFNFEDPRFWYLKGYEHQSRGELDSAIDSYRQAVRLDQSHRESMLNLANCYEQQ